MEQRKDSPRFVGSPELSEEDKLKISKMSEEQLESALHAHNYSIEQLEEEIRRRRKAQDNLK